MLSPKNSYLSTFVSVFREMRSQHGIDQSAKMIKKLHDNSLKLEEFYSNMFTGLNSFGPLHYGVVKCQALKPLKCWKRVNFCLVQKNQISRVFLRAE